MEPQDILCSRCRKPITTRRRRIFSSAQPWEYDEATGVLVVICARYWLGGKCRGRTPINVPPVEQGQAA